MAKPNLGGAVKVGLDVLTTTVNDKTHAIQAQLGDVYRESTDTDNAEVWQQVGFLSRPPKPQAGKASAQAVTLTAGDHDVVIATRDLRGLELAGAIGFGETILYAAGEDGKGQARILLKKDGTVAIYTLKDNKAGGNGITIQVRPSGEIHIGSPLGGISITDGKITMMSAAGAGVQLDSGGVTLTGTAVTANGSVVLGGPSATGVATQTSMLPLMTSLIAFLAASQAFYNFPGIAALSGGTAAPAAAAAAALAVIAALPTNFSLGVKAA